MLLEKEPFLWTIIIAGPEKTPYEGKNIEIEFKLENFPFHPPKVRFITNVWHPNVDPKDGRCCDEMLGTSNKWAPTNKLVAVMTNIFSLLCGPSTENALNEEAAKELAQGTWFNHALQLAAKLP